MDFLIVTVIVAILFILVSSKFRTYSKFLPGPGYREYLRNGDMYALLSDPRRTTSSLMSLRKKHGSVFRCWLGPFDTLVSSVPADVVQIVSSPFFERIQAQVTTFQDVAPNNLLVTPAIEHRKARKSFRESFNHTFLGAFHTDMSRSAEALCEELKKHASSNIAINAKSVDIGDLIASAAFRIIASTAFGCNLDDKTREELAIGSDELLEEMLRDVIGYPFLQALSIFGTRRRMFEAKEKVERISHEYLTRRMGESKEEREARAPDLLDALVGFHKKDAVTLISNIMVFTVAGAHTVAAALKWSIYEMCLHPETADKVHEEIKSLFGDKPIAQMLSHTEVMQLKYVKHVWREALRLHPPVTYFVRRATREIALAGSGVVVPKGAVAIALNQGSQTDNEIWDLPQSFLPERWEAVDSGAKRVPPGAYIPFSAGPSNCVGQFFADYEGPTILSELYRRFEFKLACKPEEIRGVSGFSEVPKFSGDQKGRVGIPVHVKLREVDVQ